MPRVPMLRQFLPASRLSLLHRLIPPLALHHVWLALVITVSLVMSLRMPAQTLDFWWHLRVGELMLETGSIPRVDQFSLTANGQTYILQNWLAELVYALVYRLGGLPLLLAVNGLVLAGAFWLALYHSYTRTLNTRLAAGATFFGLLAAFVHTNARPQVFSALLLAAFYVILDRYHCGQRAPLWLLPVLTALWVNLHGAFVMGLALLALVTLVEGVRRLTAAPDALSYRRLVGLVVTTVR